MLRAEEYERASQRTNDGMTRLTTIPWVRVCGEGMLIVVSVILGLALDGWWDGRQANRLEADILTAVKIEIAANREALNENREANKGHLVLMDRFLRSDSGTLRGVSVNSAREWI